MLFFGGLGLGSTGAGGGGDITREINMDSKFIIQMHGQKTTITNLKVAEGHTEGDSFREQLRTKDFTFDFSFWTVDSEDKEKYDCQETVYKALGVDVVDSAYEGYNACVFAYGQTGSGKTYTMMGPHDDPGLIPRICQELFTRMTDGSTRYRTEVSYLEIYNEKVRDLIKSSSSGKVQHTLRVREHPKEGPYVQGLSKFIVKSFQEIEGLMLKGNAVRTTASTNMNDVSSRSHAIFTIVFTQATIKDGIPSEKTSKVHLVDLAGSERATATGATGQRLREGGSINKSLVSLGTVIKLLAELSEKGSRLGKTTFIPYRDSTLTWLLKDSLGGNSRTIMVTTISPADVNYAETLSALRYANRAKNIINRPTVNEDQNVKIIRELREEIDRLRAMIGGNIDNISTPKVKERLHESEARVKVLTDEWTEKWKDIASILKEQDTLALRKEGLGVVLDSTLPHLIGIDDDILSTGIMLYHLKAGTTRIGRSDADPPVDIVIAGLEVEKEHCTIDNTSNSVTLTPFGEALCSVNGNLVEETTKLTQGAVILLGRTNMFRFNNPAEAAKMKKELKKSGVNIPLSRTSILSQSMTDLYKSSENLSAVGGWENDQSHREELEKIEELKQQIKNMEDRYHEAEEERINRQVAMEMELEKKQNSLDQAYKDLEKIQKDIVKAHTDDVIIKLPKGEEIEKLLKKLDERENQIMESARATRDSLTQEMDQLRLENEEGKKATMAELARLEDAIKLRDREMEKLDKEVENKRETGRSQDEEDQKVIDIEQEQLEKMQQDFEILFRSKLEENEPLMKQYEEVAKENIELRSEFEAAETEMKDRWKTKVDEIARENEEIEEAWKDLFHQEKRFIEQLKNDRLSEEEREDIEHNKGQLEEARVLLKLEEQKVASRERHILDAIEKEMEEWENHKQKDLKKIEQKKIEIAKRCRSPELETLRLKILEKEATVQEFKADLQKQEEELHEFEKHVEKEKIRLIEEKEQIFTDKDEINDIQCKDFIRLEKQIIEWNEKLNSVDEKMTEELAEIQEERERLLLLKKSSQKSETQTEMDETELDTTKLSQSERQKLEKKKKELEELQASVDKAAEELEEKIRKFDYERDHELDEIEFEKDSLQERRRQDRINALVEQEVKRRMFEEKVTREQKRQLERDREKKEREEEIKKLKEAHFREIKQLKDRFDMYEKNRRSRSIAASLIPTKSNPYASIMSADSEGDTPRRKSTCSVTTSISVEAPPSVIITIPTFRLHCYGSDAHYEYEIKIVIGEDIWSIYRRYSRFREFHQDLKKRIPQIEALVFPPKKFFSKREIVAAERRTQLEFYLRSVIEICSKIPDCVLHPSKNPFLSKQVLCEFDTFFKKGLFEPTKYGTT